RRRHTRSKRDWSSDVCSSDLGDNSLVSLYVPFLLIITATTATIFSSFSLLPLKRIPINFFRLLPFPLEFPPLFYLICYIHHTYNCLFCQLFNFILLNIMTFFAILPLFSK